MVNATARIIQNTISKKSKRGRDKDFSNFSRKKPQGEGKN